MKVLKITDHRRDFAGMTYIYPVLSRRAGGVSVGINLNPNNACNWHCVYCQVPDLVRGSAPPIDMSLLEDELRSFLAAVTTGDYLEQHVPEGLRQIMDIAFSGNGEPTSAVDFDQIVGRVIEIRDQAGLSDVPVRLITNGSLVYRPPVQRALELLAGAGGEVWFKVDAAATADVERINGVSRDPDRTRRLLSLCASLCPTWVQTCLFAWDGEAPTDAQFNAYLDCLSSVGVEQLKGVLLYGVARDSMQPEANRVTPLSESRLRKYGERIKEKGLTVRVSP